MTDKPDPRAPRATPQARWRQRNPLAHWAHGAFRSALKRGLVQPQPCAVCGDANAEAHHDPDAYDRVLDVQWLCRKHHKAAHAERRAKA